ncbi:uncharacterized protein LOC133462192 [Cololabis saira]|uniref:uncharacterized protein LOC133462192 n=1 Tax=Cololabis saira TaxID=129043 RepID=UPI002AD404DB|nr:uncharacterized protein LOC133462192 [Cololabis saira]
MNGLPVRASGTAPAGDASSLSAPTNGDNHDVSNDDGDDTDDDLVILDTASTPKPQKPLSGLEEVKEEEGETQISMLLECSDNAAVDATAETATTGTSPSRPATVETGHPPAVVNTTTQAEVGEVKQEKDSEDPTEMRESSAHSHAGTERRSDFGIPALEQRGFKQERSDDSPRATPSQRALQNGAAGDEGAGPSSASASNDYFTKHFPTFNLVQEDLDQLLELMQDTAQERDRLNEQVHKLTSQLEDTQRRLQELSHLSAKGKGLHKACQTDQTETERDYYKNLFEKTKQKVSDLVKDKEALTAAAETGVATAQDDENDIDEILQRIGCLVQQLDQRNKERDELCSQTGGSKGYAFGEYECDEVAQIVAETMNNYLMGERIIKCHVVPPEKVHEKLFVGSQREFKKPSFPAVARYNKKHSAEQIAKMKLPRKESKLREPLVARGIDYDFPGFAAQVPQKTKSEALNASSCSDVSEPCPCSRPACDTTPPVTPGFLEWRKSTVADDDGDDEIVLKLPVKDEDEEEDVSGSDEDEEEQ